jgi:hypothetical protein
MISHKTAVLIFIIINPDITQRQDSDWAAGVTILEGQQFVNLLLYSDHPGSILLNNGIYFADSKKVYGASGHLPRCTKCSPIPLPLDAELRLNKKF